MEEQHQRMMRRPFDVGKLDQPTAAHDGMDIDWIAIADDRMPVKLLRGSSPSLSTLDFSSNACNAEGWDFANDEHLQLAGRPFAACNLA